MKKLLSLIFLTAMCLSMGISAMAGGIPSGGASYSCDTIVPALNVEVIRVGNGGTGNSLPFILNPYGVSLTDRNGAWIDSDGDTSQINSAPVFIRTASMGGVRVAVQNTQLIVSNGIEAITKPVTGISKKKQVFVYLDLEMLGESSSRPDAPDMPEYSRSDNQLVLTKTLNISSVTLGIIEPLETSGSYQWACLRASGNASSRFNTSSLRWETTDRVDIDYTLRFTNAMAARE